MEHNYIKIPNLVLKNAKLTASDKLLYGILNSLAHKDNKITASNQFLSDTLGLSVITVKRSLSVLKEQNYITITNSNKYRIIKMIPVKPEITFFRLEIDEETNDLLDRVFEKL